MNDAPIRPGNTVDVLYGDDRFVAWRYERGPSGTPAKVPYTPGLGARARSNDPMTWRSYAEAQATLEKGAVDGISYALAGREGLAALDLDDCIGADSTLSPWAHVLIEAAQSYTEITPSKLGLRIIGAVAEPVPHMHFKLSRGDNGAAVEIYHKATRFITLSRVPFGPEVPFADITPVLAALDRERATRSGPTEGGSADPISLPSLPHEIRDLILNGSATGTRSENLLKVVGWLRRAGYVRAAIEATLRDYPGGIAARCFEQGKDDLHRQVQLCIDKVDDDEAARRQQRQSQASSGWRGNSISASALQQQQFPPMKAVIPGLLTEGVTLLAGKPKRGKSWFGIDLAVSVATPRICFGDFVPVQGDVLYIALEDNPRRLQRRLKHILVHDDAVWPDRLTFAFTWRGSTKAALMTWWNGSASTPRRD